MIRDGIGRRVPTADSHPDRCDRGGETVGIHDTSAILRGTRNSGLSNPRRERMVISTVVPAVGRRVGRKTQRRFSPDNPSDDFRSMSKPVSSHRDAVGLSRRSLLARSRRAPISSRRCSSCCRHYLIDCIALQAPNVLTVDDIRFELIARLDAGVASGKRRDTGEHDRDCLPGCRLRNYLYIFAAHVFSLLLGVVEL